MCFYGASRQTNNSFNIYLSPVGVKSLRGEDLSMGIPGGGVAVLMIRAPVLRLVINWQAGAKLIQHVRQINGFMTPNTSDSHKKRHDRFN